MSTLTMRDLLNPKTNPAGKDTVSLTGFPWEFEHDTEAAAQEDAAYWNGCGYPSHVNGPIVEGRKVYYLAVVSRAGGD